jgi:hypothetical protein
VCRAIHVVTILSLLGRPLGAETNDKRGQLSPRPPRFPGICPWRRSQRSLRHRCSPSLVLPEPDHQLVPSGHRVWHSR